MEGDVIVTQVVLLIWTTNWSSSLHLQYMEDRRWEGGLAVYSKIILFVLLSWAYGKQQGHHVFSVLAENILGLKNENYCSCHIQRSTQILVENCVFGILPIEKKVSIMVPKTHTILQQFYCAYGVFFIGHVTQPHQKT